MKAPTAEDVRRYLKTCVNLKLEAEGRAPLAELADDYDLLLSGVVDSLGFMELVTATANEFGRTLDFEFLEPEQMTLVGPLCAFVSSQPLAS